MDSISHVDLNAALLRLRAAHQQYVPDYAQRSGDLKRLRAVFQARLEDFATAMSDDFGRRSRHESLLTDGMTVLSEIDYLLSHLRRLMRPTKAAADVLFFPARAEIRYQPLGVVGVIAPWNYPVNLAIVPLATAIAAGNHVMLKPSENTPRTSALLRDMLAEVFPDDRVATVLGGPDVAERFAALPFDHLFFTGSTAVGRKVMMAAAQNLTPVTLELGGKSPVIVAENYPVAKAVDRIAAGKFLNAGQTCVAPDYVLLPGATIPPFVDEMKKYISRRYGVMAENADYSSVINDAHYARQTRLLEQARRSGAEVIPLADNDAARRCLAPTLIVNPHADLDVMQQEIFGPILPLIAIESIDTAIDFINARPRPLALYVFDTDKAMVERVLQRTTAGGVSVNDTVMQFAQVELPFGGVGPSGMGQYHGHQGFLTFSKQTSVLYQARWTMMKLLRPPYRGLADFIAKFLTR
ncbi:MAG TPA: coniferyl aldehyde dehydrogenase [Rudaea sp.]|nr:coniferyl aldehyde dehydrogenase [Rudaea sp.]